MTIFVVLRCPLDRQEPALAPLHPDLGFRLQSEGCLIQTSEPNLDERVAALTLEELSIEAFFPADEATARVLQPTLMDFLR